MAASATRPRSRSATGRSTASSLTDADADPSDLPLFINARTGKQGSLSFARSRPPLPLASPDRISSRRQPCCPPRRRRTGARGCPGLALARSAGGPAQSGLGLARTPIGISWADWTEPDWTGPDRRTGPQNGAHLRTGARRPRSQSDRPGPRLHQDGGAQSRPMGALPWRCDRATEDERDCHEAGEPNPLVDLSAGRIDRHGSRRQPGRGAGISPTWRRLKTPRLVRPPSLRPSGSPRLGRSADSRTSRSRRRCWRSTLVTMMPGDRGPGSCS